MKARIKIAKPGYDVNTIEQRNLSFDSDKDCFNVIQEFSSTITTDSSGNGGRTFTHSLGYYPMYKVFAKEKTAGLLLNYWMPFVDIYMTGGVNGVGGSQYATTSIIRADILGGAASATYDIKVIVFGNEVDGSVGTGNDNVTGMMRVAKSGQDLETATDLRQLQFQSGKYTLKYDTALSGVTASTTTGAGTLNNIDITHNLGYVPFAFVVESQSANSRVLPIYDVATRVGYGISSTKIRIEIDNISNLSSYTATYKYHIFRDKIA